MNITLEEIVKFRYKIIESLKKCIKICERELPLNSLRDSILSKNKTNNIGIIVEYKRSSPRGIVRLDVKPDEYVEKYRNIACGFSVLVEPYWFLGSLEYIPLIKNISKLPILYKDFIVDEWQIDLAWYFGADAILLIYEVLEDKIDRYVQHCLDLGLEVVLESHDPNILIEFSKTFNDRVLLGLNSRNLKTLNVEFEKSLNNLKMLRENVKNRLIIFESGISSLDDINNIWKLGANAVLVGTFFMKSF